jgi:3-oxoacyl-(acyl-carrier-protein) synthase/acyl carrier protein
MTALVPAVLELLAENKISREVAKTLLARSVAAGPQHVAIVGVALDLPGARSLDEFWLLLHDGADLITELPPERRALGPDGDGKPRAAWLTDIDRFDAEFFGIPPAEAKVMDPQQRRFLQTAYHCLEDAGYPTRIRGTRTGVYVSAAMVDYLDAIGEATPVAVPANVHSFVASRLSHLLDLRGPAFVASATCASSLLALHQACAGLRVGDCEQALVGGVNIFPFPTKGPVMMDVAGISSLDERCRPFDDAADGIGKGEGVIAVLLKPLDKALGDGDRVHAVIRGSAVNNDGAGAALTAPNPIAHTELLVEAWRRAGISPESLCYIEAHGTGTKLGDPIEVKGITDAVRKFTDRRQFIGTGSVKGNIGHLVDGVAGLSGLLKALLVLTKKCVPPTVHLHEPNQHIDFLDSPVYVPDRPWPLAGEHPLRTGVSCFGFNGTNVHVVLEEPPRQDREPRKPESLTLPLSARTPEALRALLKAFGEATIDADLHDVAFTLNVGRERFKHRVTVRASSVAEFQQRCRELSDSDQWPQEAEDSIVDWTGCQIVDLPRYPFQEKSYWIEPRGSKAGPDTGGDVLAIVRSVLGVEHVSPTDQFLAIGGTSLSGLQLINELRRAFDISLSLEDLLAATDLAAMAETVQQRIAPATLFPLSFAQRRFWFLEQTEPGAGFYHVPMLLRLRGKLDVEALRWALTTVGNRHDVLRSRYPTGEDGLPVMEIGAPGEFPLPITDLRGMPEREDRARQLAVETTEQVFDLDTGPVWRGRLIRVDDEHHLLVLVMHHLVTDIWSMSVLENDLRTAYEAKLTGRPTQLPDLPVGYGEASVAEHRDLAGDRGKQLARFWTDKVASYGDPLELPTDRPRPTERALTGDTIGFDVPADIETAVRELCTQERVTPFMVFLSAFKVLLQRRIGRDDVLIGTEAANRIRPDTDRMVGSFVNQLALRTDLTGDPSFHEVLSRVRRTTLDAYDHQDLPFDRLVVLTRTTRDPASAPLFRLKFLFNSLSWGSRPFGGLDVEVDDLDIHISPFDLTLRVFEQPPGRFTGSASYSTALFERATVQTLVADYLSLLADLLTKPSLHLSKITLTSQRTERPRPADRATSLREFRRRAPLRASNVVITSLAEGVDRPPLVVQPTAGGVDLAGWIAANQDPVEQHLLTHGAILFHGFNIRTVEEFHTVATTIHPQLVEYSEPSTPRGEYQDKVYVSSEYPSWFHIPLHGELSYTYKWPMKALFWCRKAAVKGGATPIGDAQRILDVMRPEVRARFVDKQVMYVRNYGNGMLVPWQKVFKTDDRAEVERYCRENAPMTCEWLDGDRLRTTQVRPAVATHPVTGAQVWFNQAHIFHAYSLGADLRDKLVSQFGEDGLPVHARYGDGTPIEDWEIDEVNRCCQDSSWISPWTEGDVLLADNMLTAHGRQAFEGDREVIVCFVEPCPPVTS